MAICQSVSRWVQNNGTGIFLSIVFVSIFILYVITHPIPEKTNTYGLQNGRINIPEYYVAGHNMHDYAGYNNPYNRFLTMKPYNFLDGGFSKLSRCERECSHIQNGQYKQECFTLCMRHQTVSF